MNTFLKSVALMTFLVCGGFGECEDPRIGLAFAGYTQLSPPSSLFVPGAVVVMALDAQKRGELKLVCGPRAAFSSSYHPRISDTMSSSLQLSKSQRIELEADAVGKFRARTNSEDVSSVSVTFSNARILESDDSELWRLVKFRTPECTAAIAARVKAGFQPTMVSSAFIADVTYEVQFKRSLSLEKRVAESKMADIAGKLGGGITEISDHSLRASNLVIGIRTDLFLMGIRPHASDYPLPAVSSETDVDRSFGASIDVNGAADAPLVPPTFGDGEGGWVSPVRGP